MLLKEFLQLYEQHPHIHQLLEWIQEGKLRHLHAEGLVGSSRSLVFAALQQQYPMPLLIIMADAEAAAYCYNDITQALGKETVNFFPSAFRRSPKQGDKDTANIILRSDSLNRIASGQPFIVVTSPEGLAEKVITKNELSTQCIHLQVGNEIDVTTLCDQMISYGFTQVDFVYEPGQFSLRGSIVDVFSFTYERPYRIDFFGDEIESIRTFDIEKQLSLDPIQSISIVPDISVQHKEKTISLLEFIPENTWVAIQNHTFTAERINQIYDETLVKANSEKTTPDLDNLLLTSSIYKQQIKDFHTIEFGTKSSLGAKNTVHFSTSIQPLFHKNFDLVSSQFKQFIEEGNHLYVATDSKKQTDRLKAIFEDRGDVIPFTPILNTIHEGFIDHDMAICCFTDHQIFDRFHKFSLKSDVARTGKVALTLKELNQFQIGDYVVHIDHGVGKFGGLMRQTNNGKTQEVIKLIYKDDDVIFVSIHGLHRISKYKGKDGTPPTLNKVGSGAWERLKERTKSKVKDIARDLILLYAKRKSQKGFEYSKDSYLQQELEASFIYEDTPDQMTSTADIKRDMESDMPMDRLVCGDVGFGKTEIAIRAAFKAVTDGKQVAVLVPTTVLAFQHYKTFSERLKEFPCRVEYLSRARKPAEVKAIKKDLEEGKIDILIGTHKVVGKDIHFKDLGLLVVDEEQKFGVGIKEKLKALKVNVDTLTLTATPIPRTLQFSLMGARDLSILTTPPPNRYPVLTEVSTFNDEVIHDAIVHEMERNGQVFFINNRIQNIYLIEQKIHALVPEARVAIAHGQLPPDVLERTILDFVDYEYDVLIATSVVESGIDIPNVNTIIVNNAHMFGLSDLHQLRGRVGRSNRKAYCYLLAPSKSLLTTDARRRLEAIETFSDLGSGFHISMQDLDIRGAGNILGAEQSGFITDLGYETYQKILNEALEELRDEEFSELFADKKELSKDYVTDCSIESDLELMFPFWYIENVSERMSLYRELDNMPNEEALKAYEKRLVDRFGKIPAEGQNLIQVVRLRWIAKKYGIERLILKNGNMSAHLVNNSKSPFYNSPEFGALLTYLTNHPRATRISENHGKRIISFNGIDSIEKAYNLFTSLQA